VSPRRKAQRRVFVVEVDPDRDGWYWRSPCHDILTGVQDWMVTYAQANTDGVLQIQCGRYMTDPLRATGAVPTRGCATVHPVPVGDLRRWSQLDEDRPR